MTILKSRQFDAFEKLYYVEMCEHSDGCSVLFEITQNPGADRGTSIYKHLVVFETKDMSMNDCYTRGWAAFNRILSAIKDCSDVKFDRAIHGRKGY
jgi:hypothetical protein